MKILHVIPSLGFGGAENVMLNLAYTSSKKGNKVVIVAIYGSNVHKKELDANDIEHIILSDSKKVNLKNILFLIKISRSLLKTIKGVNPDIVHAHLFISKLLLLLLSPFNATPILQTQHDNSPWWAKTSIMARMMSLIEAFFSYFVAEHNVAISNSVRKDLISKFKLKESKVSVIYNAVAENVDYKPKTRNNNRNDFKIFIVSRLTWSKKGLDVVIAIAKEIIEGKSINNVKFIVVGDGPDRIKMEKEIESNNISSFFEFRGYQSDIYLQYQEADVLLMPSRWEGFGLVAAEAALSGVPVVGSATGGLKEVVLDKKTGYLCPVNDTSCFSSKLISLSKEKDVYIKISEFARLDALERFQIERVSKQYEELYKEIILR